MTLLLEWGTEFTHYFREEAIVSEERVQGQKRVMRTENTPNSSFKKRQLNLKLVPPHRGLYTKPSREANSPHSSHEDLERNRSFALGGLKSAAFYNYTRVIKQGIPGSGVCTLPDRKAAITGMAVKAASPDYISHNPRCLLPSCMALIAGWGTRHPAGKAASCVA